MTFLWVHLSPFLPERRFRLMALIASVSGMEDTLLEGDEAFDAMITGTDQSAVVSVGASDTATVTITDNDGAYDRDRSYVCVISETHIYVRTLFCIVHKSFFQLGRLR